MTEAMFTADRETRTVRGLLLPYGEESRPSASGAEPVLFERGSVSLPRDPSVLTLNVAHDRFAPVGRATSIEDTDAGVAVEFSVADTDEGDEALTGIESGRLAKLSAEVGDFLRDGAKAVKAKLTGAALVEEGAFASAALFSIASEATPETPADEADEDEPEAPVEADEDTPSEETPNEGVNVTENVATLPEGVASPAGSEKIETTESALFGALAKHGRDGDASALFAISNVQHSGPSAVTIGADTQDAAYLGELWSKNPYARKFLPLFEQRALSSFKVDGWRWVTEPTVAAYSGNVSDVPSGAVDTEPVTASARRIAGGHRLDRRFADFGDQGVIESYFRIMTESYARVTDADILAKAITAAGTAVAVGTASGGPVALDAVVDGALSVIASENTPSFAIVSPELWRDIVLTGKNDTLGYLNAGFGLESGSAEGFSIIPGSVGTGNVLVGSRNAMTVFELPGSPIRVEGISPHQGAIDPALYGYLADLTNNSDALALIKTVAG